MSKCPGWGQNDLLPLQCDSGKSRKFIDKTTHQNRFRDNSITFSETIHQQHFFRFWIKEMIMYLWVVSKSISELSHKVVASCLKSIDNCLKNVSFLSICTQLVFVQLQKNVYFQSWILYFLILAQNIGCGYTLDLNRPPWTPFYTANLWVYKGIHYFFLI